jgi:hypothetical protein
MTTVLVARARRRGALLAAGMVLLAAGVGWGMSQPSTSAPPVPSASSPEDAVKQLFSLVLAGRCDQAAAVVATAPNAEGLRDPHACREIVESVRQHPLERIVSVAADGRNPRLRLVTAQLRNSPGLRTFTVSKNHDDWRVEPL